MDEATGWARLARDWSELSENQRIMYTIYVLKANVDLVAMRDRLNTVCGTYGMPQAGTLTLAETQEIRTVIEAIARL